MMGLYLEEIEIGFVADLGSHHFSRDGIIAFARKYDPQPFHLDEAAALKGPFGRLSASGWHTAAGWMKCYIATNHAAWDKMRASGREPAPLGPSPGFTNLRWLKPVCPGDTIAYWTTVTAKRELKSRPGWGMVSAQAEGFNQDGALIYSFESKALTPKQV